MLERQRKESERRNHRRGSAEYFSVSDTVYVTVRGEVESWQEGIDEQVVSPAAYLVEIGDGVRFSHVDHLRKRWTSAATCHRTQPQGTEACQDITARKRSHTEPSSEGNNVIPGSGLDQGISRGVSRDERNVQSHDGVDEDEDVPDPRTTKATASTSVNDRAQHHPYGEATVPEDLPTDFSLETSRKALLRPTTFSFIKKGSVFCPNETPSASLWRRYNSASLEARFRCE